MSDRNIAQPTRRVRYGFSIKLLRNWNTLAKLQIDQRYVQWFDLQKLVYGLEVEQMYSEVSPSGLYHLHGIVTLPSTVRFLDVKHGTDPTDLNIDFRQRPGAKWMDYMQKQHTPWSLEKTRESIKSTMKIVNKLCRDEVVNLDPVQTGAQDPLSLRALKTQIAKRLDEVGVKPT